MKQVLYLGILLANIFVVNAQKSDVKRADMNYQTHNYIDAIQTYEKVANKGYRTVDMLEKLGNAYYFNAKYADAAKWYSQLFSMQPIPNDLEYYFRYAQSLKSIGDYELADQYFDKFYKANGNDQRAQLFKAERNYLEVIESNSGRFTIENVKAVNSELSDYGSIVYDGNLVFTSTRTNGERIAPKRMGWNDQPFSSLYSSVIDSENKATSEVSTFPKLETKYNESTPVFTKDGNTVYFTRNNFLKRTGFSQDRQILLKVYKAVKDENGKWGEVKELPFNSDDYNVAHPALSSDEKFLYFASNMPGTLGDADIWKVEIKSDDTYGEPINLGPTVNTEGRESFPFITSENELYYASTGKLGLGGLDVFVSKIEGDTYTEAVNVGKPINSQVDDFGFYFNPVDRTGYFTSNRDGGVGDDDIYSFIETRLLDCLHLLKGQITEKNSNIPLANATVSLLNDDNKVLATTVSDSSGNYNFDNTFIKCDHPFRVRAELENYASEEGSIVIPNQSGESILNLNLTKVKTPIVPGMDLAKILNIPIIYFDLDKSFIRPDAAIEIAKVLEVMKEYPKMKIDIRSHTDCRQTYAYNEKLSDRRAKSTRDWLIKNGIEPNRLTARGYGESQLVNDCACEPTNKSTCTEEEHQKNRRSEFIVMSMGE